MGRRSRRAWRSGSPPRVRSRQQQPVAHQRRDGITSACAEQTALAAGAGSASGDHLRVCGADLVTNPVLTTAPGSPPRVRSRREDDASAAARRGITSACAEQTMVMPPALVTRQDHLRVCGADEIKLRVMPREVRITSACAEQTVRPFWTRCAPWDHLRVCGADHMLCGQTHEREGSPPRVRSRLASLRHHPRSPGIISACAEQTSRSSFPLRACRDHLRVCGADPDSFGSLRTIMGSPPRVRSRLKGIDIGHILLRITSACAEQTEE